MIFSLRSEVLFWFTKSYDCVWGGNVIIIRFYTFICVWSWVLNEGRKLGKDVHAGGV